MVIGKIAGAMVGGTSQELTRVAMQQSSSKTQFSPKAT
jgi:hypothetical protein